MTGEPGRPWRRKKRWAAAAVWLLLASYVTGYAASGRRVAIDVSDDTPKSRFWVTVEYRHPALRRVFAPAEWVDRRIRPAYWWRE